MLFKVWCPFICILFFTNTILHIAPEVIDASSNDDDWYSTKGRRLVLHMSDANAKVIVQEIHDSATLGQWDLEGKHGLHKTSLPETVGRVQAATASPIKIINFCINCPSPEDEGSIASAISSYHMMATLGNAALSYNVLSEAVYVVPNYVDHAKVLNVDQIKGRIALIKRGRQPIGHKVSKLLEKASPNAIVIIDDGQCDEAFISCGYRAGGVREGGFAPFDDTDTWERALMKQIPVLLVSATTGAKFDALMALREVDVLGMGPSNMTLLPLSGDNSVGSGRGKGQRQRTPVRDIFVNQGLRVQRDIPFPEELREFEHNSDEL